MRRTAPPRAAAALLLGAVLLAVLARPPEELKAKGHLGPLLPRPQLLTILGAGYRQVLADYFWVQTLQACIAARTPEEARDIYDYAKVVIGLDPKFRPIYMFAGASLPTLDAKHVWRNTDESIDVLERGMKQFPDYVLLRILLAYNLSTFAHQYGRAAQILAEASKLKGAPPYLPALATRLYAQAGDYDAGLMLAETLAKTADDPDTRATFERRVNEIRLERILQQIDQATAAFRRQAGRLPVSIGELVSAHLLKSIPPDPLGGSLVIRPDGRAYSTESRRLEFEAKP